MFPNYYSADYRTVFLVSFLSIPSIFRLSSAAHIGSVFAVGNVALSRTLNSVWWYGPPVSLCSAVLRSNRPPVELGEHYISRP